MIHSNTVYWRWTFYFVEQLVDWLSVPVTSKSYAKSLPLSLWMDDNEDISPWSYTDKTSARISMNFLDVWICESVCNRLNSVLNACQWHTTNRLLSTADPVYGRSKQKNRLNVCYSRRIFVQSIHTKPILRSTLWIGFCEWIQFLTV